MLVPCGRASAVGLVLFFGQAGALAEVSQMDRLLCQVAQLFMPAMGVVLLNPD